MSTTAEPIGRTTRILVVTDHAEPAPEVLDAIERRAAAGDTQWRLVILNPARAELHLLHPERHDKAHQAESALRAALPRVEQAAGGPVIGSVSVRHDPMDAVEEVIFSEPVDEIMLAVPGHHLSTRLHQDLQHRLHHFGLPVTSIGGSALG